MKLAILILIFSGSAFAGPESWSVNGKTFDSKALAIRYVMGSGKRGVEITHTRCEILTNKLTFKACPKNKASNFENEAYTPPVSGEGK